MKLHHLICALLIGLSGSAWGQENQKEPIPVVLFAIDTSSKVQEFQPPESQRAAVREALNLIAMTPAPIAVGVIQYGSTINVIGAKDRIPSTSLQTIEQLLHDRWMSSGGGRPTEEAFQELIRIIHNLPKANPVTLIHLSCGRPDSGRLQPDHYPKIAEKIALRKRQITENTKAFSAELTQEALAQFEQELKDPSTAEFQELYTMQQPVEFERTKQHADAIRKADVRVVTLNFTDSAEIEELHRLSGGDVDDHIVTSPSETFTTLASMLPTIVPELIQLPSVESDADPVAFERTLDIPVEPLAEGVTVVVEFKPAIADFATHATFTAAVGGSNYEYSENDDASLETRLYHDAEGNVSLARLTLQSPSADAVTLKWESPQSSLHPPAMRVITLITMDPDVRPILRPMLKDTSARPPFVVSPKARMRWRFSLQVSDSAEPYPARKVEVQLKDRRQSLVVPLQFEPDDSSPGVFVTNTIEIPAGIFDAHISIQLPSGILLRFTSQDAIRSRNVIEVVSVEHPQPVGDDLPDGFSDLRSHLGFGAVGDAIHRRSLKVILRLRSVDYPVPVRMDCAIVDSEGQVPGTRWIQVGREEFTLTPGRKETVRLTLQLPDQIENSIRDGAFDGEFTLTRTDTGQVLRTERFEEIAGVASDEPVNRISFFLKRPTPGMSICHAFRQWIRDSSQGHRIAQVRVDVALPFERVVELQVTNTSTIQRTISIIASGANYDEHGRRVPAVRLVPLFESVANEFEPGETRHFPFQFQIDSDCQARSVTGGISVSGQGLVEQFLPVEMRRRDTLLAETICTSLRWAAVIFGTILMRSLWRWIRSRSHQTGRSGTVSSRRGTSVWSIEKSPNGCRLVAEEMLSITTPDQSSSRRIQVGRTVTLIPEEIREDSPVLIQSTERVDAPIYRIESIEVVPDDDGIEASFVVDDGGFYDLISARSRRSIVRALFFTAICILVAVNFDEPSIAWCFQFVVDALFHFA